MKAFAERARTIESAGHWLQGYDRALVKTLVGASEIPVHRSKLRSNRPEKSADLPVSKRVS